MSITCPFCDQQLSSYFGLHCPTSECSFRFEAGVNNDHSFIFYSFRYKGMSVFSDPQQNKTLIYKALDRGWTESNVICEFDNYIKPEDIRNFLPRLDKIIELQVFK